MIEIRVFHDTVCPWCRIGKKNLEKALSQWNYQDYKVVYHTFFLNDRVDEKGWDFKKYMSRLKGDGNLDELFRGVVEAGKNVGLTFNFDKIQFYPNTVLSHLVIHATPTEKKSNILDAITKAYFEDGLDIGDKETLIKIASETCWTEPEIRAVLESKNMPLDIVTEDHDAREKGMNSVPFFVIGRYGFSGAQPADFILKVLEKAQLEVA